MPLSVYFDHPHYPDGHQVEVKGLGLVANRDEGLEVDEDRERSFVSQHGKSVQDFFAEDENFRVEGSGYLTSGEASEIAEEHQNVSDTPELAAEEKSNEELPEDSLVVENDEGGGM